MGRLGRKEPRGQAQDRAFSDLLLIHLLHLIGPWCAHEAVVPGAPHARKGPKDERERGKHRAAMANRMRGRTRDAILKGRQRSGSIPALQLSSLSFFVLAKLRIHFNWPLSAALMGSQPIEFHDVSCHRPFSTKKSAQCSSPQ